MKKAKLRELLEEERKQEEYSSVKINNEVFIMPKKKIFKFFKRFRKKEK